MNNAAVNSLANAYKDEYWNKLAQCFPSFNNKSTVPIEIPNDVLSALVGILGESVVEQWLNTELKLLGNNRALIY
ncbi:hypothetical protein J2T12_000853 [Paenibacillus anaericanus]|uniref:hypothetical protein n=1 Tax=Paenibacillus anaericanus TaxID=170367 RepID=UPI00278A3FC8|nr:hypothetical protein [Paenibacillus anaericanus]MDQ0087459.1 hypothetical protein [Paenibacillus anaericanus]